MRKAYVLAGICCLFISKNVLAQNWEKMADLPVAFSFPVVVELGGNIHVMGGGGPSGATDLHLRYRPTMNKWDTMAAVPYLAQQPAGAVLNGKIHFFGGGYPNSGTRLNKHYVYDPMTNSWTAAANLPQARAIHKAAVVNGKLYSMSGQPDKSLVEEYNPATNSWTTKNSLPDQNFWYSAIVSSGGKIYRFGGGGYTAPVNYAHVYNSANDSWTALPALPQAMHAIAGTAYGNFIFLGGGYNSGPVNKVWLYDVVNNNYITGTPMLSARDYHDMVTVGNCIYAVGGDNSADATVKTSLLRYCPAANVSVKKMAEDAGWQLQYKASAVVLSIPAAIGIKPVILSLYDMSGRLMWSRTVVADDKQNIQFTAEGIEKGVYLLRAEAGQYQYSGRLPVFYNE